MLINLSKPRIMAGLQCPKRLCLQVCSPELKDELDDTSRAVIEQGEEVGCLAQTMFPGGLLIEKADDLDLGRAIEPTAAAVASDEIPALFEVKFQHDGVLVRTDILERQSKTRWRLIEVKAATPVKKHHFYSHPTLCA